MFQGEVMGKSYMIYGLVLTFGVASLVVCDKSMDRQDLVNLMDQYLEI